MSSTLPNAVTQARAVTEIMIDHATNATSEVAATWIMAHPEWSGPIMLVLVVAALAVAWLKSKAAKTDNKIDDAAVRVLEQTINKTRDKTSDDAGQ